jgi:hypothetical protein
MTEFEAAAKLLQSLGIGQILSPLLSIIAFLYLLKKYIINGTGPFIKNLLISYIDSQKATISLQAQIDNKLTDLVQKFTDLTKMTWDNREDLEGKMINFEMALREHIAETHVLILLLKKKNSDVQETLDKVDTQYFKQGVKS